MKLKEKFKAIKLRNAGKSYNDILKVINVSKSTISLWLRDIELTPEQKVKLIVGQDIGRMKASKNRQRARIKKTKEIITMAKKELPNVSKNPLFLPGLMLYWAEGTKHSGEQVQLVNSDPAMIEFMMRWFREVCKVPEKKFRISLHIHSLHCRTDILDFWSKITKIPLNQFRKVYVKPTSLGQRRNILYNGTCGIIVCNKDLFRRIKGWKLGFLENLNITYDYPAPIV